PPMWSASGRVPLVPQSSQAEWTRVPKSEAAAVYSGAAAAIFFWVPQRSRVTREISEAARSGFRSSQAYMSSARFEAMVAYQPCRKSLARIPATVVIEGYISGPSGSRRYMRPRGVSALREGVVIGPRRGAGVARGDVGGQPPTVRARPPRGCPRRGRRAGG